MTTKRLAAICLAAGAVAGGVATSPAMAEDGASEGSVPINGPGSCDVVVWWDTRTNPMAGAEVPHPLYCIQPILDSIRIQG